MNKPPCWKCHEAVSGPVCVGCGALQPPPKAHDPFALLGVERDHRVETERVEQAYRDASRQVHPDRFVRRSAVERRMSLEWSGLVTEARRVLLDPRARARWLATGRAAPLERKDGGGLALDPEFLDEVFEWNSRRQEHPEATRAWALERRGALERTIDQAFAEGQLDQVEPALDQLRYVDNLLVEP